MTAARLVAVALLALIGGGRAHAADYAPGRPLERFAGPRADYAFRCKGCHGFAGEGTPGHVPRLAGFVSLYTHLPEGRDYLMRVPGVARSALDDAKLAGVLNWMLQVYGAGQVAPGFAPFTAEEVGHARRRPLAQERDALRARLLGELRGRGLVGAGEDGLGSSAERRG
ncbi:MAG TPA: cytochrome c [Geminicoccaceae bacterium]|nr:cytochrome c [Geminicoccaceae bacterium]